MKLTFRDARNRYLQRATLKSQHTLDSYARAIALFFSFLSEKPADHKALPIQLRARTSIGETPLTELSAGDAPLFLNFTQWMLSPGSGKPGDNRPFKPSTVDLRVAGVINWFQFMDDHDWLPAGFPLAKAKRIVRDEFRSQPKSHRPPRPPQNIEEVITYYDNLPEPPSLSGPEVDPERLRRWTLTRLRNRALVKALAETGGRVSEVLSLNLTDFPERYITKQEVLRVEVRGKGGHLYYLRFFASLPAIGAYIKARGANLRAISGRIPLFISHDPRYEGTRMSRVVAWRVVRQASRALGLGNISPHDFRHWRATQLINAGYPLDVVQDYLGHRSVETTRAYYAHTDPRRVDEIARNVQLLGSEFAE